MITFEEAIAFLNDNKVEFRQGWDYVGEVGKGRHKVDRKVIEGIYPPFSAEEWLDITSAESELLGPCCAVISNARDIFFRSVRQERYLRGNEIWELFERLAQHEGFEYMLKHDDEHFKEWDSAHYFGSEEKDAIYRFWKIFDTVKDHLICKAPSTTPYPEEAPIREPIQAALHVAKDGIDDLYWATSCFSATRDDDPQWLIDQRRAQRQLTIARVAPALRTILEQISALDLGDFHGFAICKRDEPDAVCVNGFGSCLFTTEAEAEEMIERWAKNRDEKDPDEIPDHWVCPRETTVIRPVHVSATTGLSFMDAEGE